MSAQHRTRFGSPLNLLRILAALLECPTNRFGKPEFCNAPDEREELRELAVAFKVGPSQTVLEQAAKVIRAALAEAGVKS